MLQNYCYIVFHFPYLKTQTEPEMTNPPFTILPYKQQQTTAWAGGTTTQLYIYPLEATYAQRNFLFRLSTATVETEHSIFTELTGFHRILMVLNGNLTITHPNRYSKELRPLETDTFEGDWQTTAIGKVTDFNVMMAAGVNGKMRAIKMQPNTVAPFQTAHVVTGLYLAKGNATINREYRVQAKDFILIQDITSIDLVAHEYCEWIISEITTLP